MAGALALFALGFGGDAVAQAPKPLCNDTKSMSGGSPQDQIAACTAIIEANKLPAKAMASAYYLRGTAYANSGESARAVEDFTKSLERNPDPEVMITRGVQYYGLGQIDRAIADFDKVIEQNPKHIVALSNRGAMYNARGQPARAIADLDKVIAAAPDNVQALSNRGAALQTAGKPDAAIADYDKIIAIDPNNPWLI